VSYNKICVSCKKPFTSESRNTMLCGSKECKKIRTDQNKTRGAMTRRKFMALDEPGAKERYCLKCGEKFNSVNGCNRLCVQCAAQNSRLPDVSTIHINLPH
jgi:hypothetical protein